MTRDELLRIGIRWAGTSGVTFYFREELFSCSNPIPAAVLDAAVAHELAHSVYALEDLAMRVADHFLALTRRVGIGTESLALRAVRKAEEYVCAQIRTNFVEGKASLKADAWGFRQMDAVAWLSQNLP